jgi:hypothetical protein
VPRPRGRENGPEIMPLVNIFDALKACDFSLLPAALAGQGLESMGGLLYSFLVYA